jgi:hypothetical protein
MPSSFDKNALMHAVQCVAAMQRFIEEHVATLDAGKPERSTLSELSADLYNALDILSEAYEGALTPNDGRPSVETLQDAFSAYTMVKKTLV